MMEATGFAQHLQMTPISADGTAEQVVEILAGACLELRERDLKVMQRLVSARDRLRPLADAAEKRL